MNKPLEIWTIGHSTRSWDAFTTMLDVAAIKHLVDVRRFAGSRRHPQFSADSMALALAKIGIEYIAMPELGGRRKARADSVNTAWRNTSFRGYADYMETIEYQNAHERLATLATHARTAIMCAEAVWWSCHRALISDDFKATGWNVIHLIAPGRSEPHPYSSAARIVDGRLDYSLPESMQPTLF